MLRGRWFKVLLVWGVLASGTFSFSQSLPQVDDARTMLDRIERTLADVQVKSLISAKQIGEFRANASDYAKSMKAAFDQALAEALKYADSEGADGTMQTLQIFESAAKDHERRLAVFQTDAQKIQTKIQRGGGAAWNKFVACRNNCEDLPWWKELGCKLLCLGALALNLG
jgi:hypothetical protein